MSDEFNAIPYLHGCRDLLDGHEAVIRQHSLTFRNAVFLAIGEARAAAADLHIEAGGERRPQHGDQVHSRRVESGGEHHGVRQAPDLAVLEGADDPVPLAIGRLARHHLAGDAAATHFVADVFP